MKNRKSDLPERTFGFAVQIVRLCQELDQKPGASRTLANQLIRSGTSIGANVQEGLGAQSEADFLTKYSIFCKEARESLYWLQLMLATDMISQARAEPLIREADELTAILTTIVKKLKERKHAR